MNPRSHPVVLVAAVAIAGLAPVATPVAVASPSGAADASIVIAIGTEPTSLDPHLVDDGAERAVNDNIYETLLARTPDGELVPLLANELPTQIDDSTWEFTLRSDVTFHNGEPFDAESVVASVDRMVAMMDEGITSNAGIFGTLAGAEALDATTVQISTDGPDGALPARMYWLKMIPSSSRDAADLSETPIGTGPYRFVERSFGVSITLESNDEYWGDPPTIPEVTYEFVADAATRLAGLKSGRYDLITNLSPDEAGQAPQVAAIEGQEHPVLILDADDGITADVRVRRALNLAIDKQAIVDGLFGGYAVIDQGQLLSSSILGYSDQLEPYPYDPDQARSLLEEAGAVGETILLVGEDGRWLKDRELLEAIAGYWTAVGLDVQLDVLEFGTYLDVLFDRSNRPDAIYVSSSNDLLDPDRQLATEYESGGSEASNTDDELAALIAQAREEFDPDVRQQLYEDALALAYDQAYFVWLINNQDIYGMSERLQWTPRVDAKLIVAEMSVTSG
ncbi:ABC transporter substrate-binding protein [soil metagenome]